MNFIDFDSYIEEKEKKNIPDIFETEGEEKFRALEKKYLHEVIIEDNAVISLGGGTPCFHHNMEMIKRNGTSVYIEMEAASLAKRLVKAKKKRPLIQGMNEHELKIFVEANLRERRPFYEQADYVLEYRGQSPDEMADRVIDIIRRI
jgi:shikimate kinase